MNYLQGTRDPGLYVLDCLFSVLVIGSLVVFVWRGLWVLLDLTLFPGDPALSAFGSLVCINSLISYIIYTFLNHFYQKISIQRK